MDTGTITAVSSSEARERSVLLARIEEIAHSLSKAQVLVLLSFMTEFAAARYGELPMADSGNALTRREREVLVLVAHGYSRRAIGQSLGISLNTAARHIANIYAKLGISSVAEATRWAFAHELISVPGNDWQFEHADSTSLTAKQAG